MMKRFLSIVVLLLSFSVLAAPTFDAVSSNYAETDVLNVNHTASGSNRYAHICVLNDAEPTAVTYGAAPAALVANAGRLHVYGLVAPATGSQVVSSDSSIGSTAQIIAVVTYTGVDQSTSRGTTVTNQNSELASIAATATSATGNLIVDCALMVQLTMDSDAAQTDRVYLPEETHQVGFLSFGMSESAGDASVSMTWTTSESFGDNAIIAVPLIAASTGGGSLLLRRRRGY